MHRAILVAAALALLALHAALAAAPSNGPAAPPLRDLVWDPLSRPEDLQRLTRLRPPGPAPRCDARVALAGALVDPDALPDQRGEWVALINLEPIAVDVRDWRIVVGRRDRSLPSLTLAGGEILVVGGPDGALPLGSVRLPNEAGVITLYDPCGARRDRLAWGGLCEPPPPGWVLRPEGRTRDGPERSWTVGAVGGCGQT